MSWHHHHDNDDRLVFCREPESDCRELEADGCEGYDGLVCAGRLARGMRCPYRLETSGIGTNAIRHVLAALTADGPVILLPDTGEGVRVATWGEVLRYSDEYRRLQVSDVLEVAGEVAE